MKANLGLYVQTINVIVETTEKTGEEMSPFYEELRQALDENKVETLPAERFDEIVEKFKAGTATYRNLSEQISRMKPPVKVIGIHKKLERTYVEYVAGCQDMVDSINTETRTVDKSAFDASEVKQDESSETITFCITRMTQLLLK